MTLEMGHDVGCRCWRCLSHHFGSWIDGLGAQTRAGRWQVFATITYKTQQYPWRKGFPRDSTGRPKADFAHHLFDKLMVHLEKELNARVDYVVADQLGSINGRFHQHAILSAEGLGDYPRTWIWEWLKERAGWSRVLPFERGAAYYISRYIGRDVNQCEWDLRVGDMNLSSPPSHPVGRTEIVLSSMLGKQFFHNSYTERKR